MTPLFIILASMAQAAEPAAKPSPSQTALYDALKARENPPTCETLAKLSPQVADDLIWLMDHAYQPAWVGIRAAYCVLTKHADEKAPEIDTWVTDPERRGLAILTIGFLNKMSDEQMERIAAKALSGPHAADAHKHLSESGDPKLMKLVE